MIKKLQVMYGGWGERWLLGTLADTGRGISFEYAPSAIARGLELSPMHQPSPRPGVSAAAYQGEAHSYGLPGFIADALPDGWGLLLIAVGKFPAPWGVLRFGSSSSVSIPRPLGRGFLFFKVICSIKSQHK